MKTNTHAYRTNSSQSLQCSRVRRRSAAGLRKRLRSFVAGLLTLGAAALPASGANILWVSDASPENAFSPPGSNYTDSGFVTLLQNAGHNVMRFNGPNAQATLLTVDQLAAINTNDLIIIGRAAGSAAWQNPQGAQWNTNIIKPLICMSPYLVRPDGNRMSWFTGGTLPDDTPVPLTPSAVEHPTTDYIFAGVAMNGTNTADLYSEPIDRNNSHIASPPVAGAVVIASAIFLREDNGFLTNGYAIVGFPEGTGVRGGADILPAYRMFFAAGSRESATAPNAIPLYTGRENLTPMGEQVFLRAVEVALNDGNAPATLTGPAEVLSGPSNAVVLQGRSITLSATVTGEGPRIVQWQRDEGDGLTFTNLPAALSRFAKTSLTLSNVSLADQGAKFQVVVSNALGMATSAVATLTVDLDLAAPVPLSVGTLDGSTAIVCFNELVDPNTGTDPGNYIFNMSGGPDVSTAQLLPDGKSVLLNLNGPLGPTALLEVGFVLDRYENAPDGSTFFTVTNLGLTAVDVGTQNPPGTNYVCGPNAIQIRGGGLDIQSTSDSMRLAYKAVTGDFDVRVRVLSFVGTNDHHESVAKALLVARETLVNNSAAVNIWATPPAPGDQLVGTSMRATAGAATNSLGASVPHAGFPNVWLRMRREGNVFTTFHSSNGTDWTAVGTGTAPLAQTLHVGLGAVSHRNGKHVTATFGQLTFATVLLPVTITSPNWAGGTFTALFQTQNGVGYTVEYKEDLGSPTWNTLTTIAGDGTVKQFTDDGPTASARFYRVVVGVP